MAIKGIYSNGVITTDAKLEENQQVVIIPVKKSAFGGLHKYANPSLIPLEKEAMSNEIVKSYLSKKDNS